MKILKKKWIFLIALFRIGVLCSKTLDGLDRVKKCMKFFNFFFYYAFDLNNEKKLFPTWVFQFERKRHFWPSLTGKLWYSRFGYCSIFAFLWINTLLHCQSIYLCWLDIVSSMQKVLCLNLVQEAPTWDKSLGLTTVQWLFWGENPLDLMRRWY